MRAALFLAAVLAFSVNSVAAPPNASALTPDEIACQSAILGGAQDFVSDKLKAIVDCNDKAGGCKSDKRDRQITKATARLTRTLDRVCRRVTLENLGFPGQCPAGGGSFSTKDLGNCLADHLEAFVDAAIALAYPSGSPPAFSGAEARCQNVIGGESRLFINRKLRARGRCLDQQTKGKVSSTVDCLSPVPPGTGDHDADRLITSAIKSLSDKLGRGCGKVDLTTIGFPGLCTDTTGGDFTTSDLDACLEAGLETIADQVAAFVFPLIGPVSTPTASPSPGAPTPTATASLGEPTGTPSAGEATPTATATTGGPTATSSAGVATPTATTTTSGPTATSTPGGPTATLTPAGGETPTPVGETSTPEAATPTPTATSTPAAGTCPTEITFTGTSTTGVLDTGWTGLGHDATVISDGTVTVSVSTCAGSAPDCGVCTYTGPIDNAAGQLKVHRCLGDSSIQCSTDADCTGGTAPCVFYFGSNLPLAAGGVATCVANTFTGGITGTADVTPGTGGQSAGTALLLSRVYSGPTIGEPCPRCVGDGTANDGVQGGTCTAGAHAGANCDASGSSPNAEWGTTSLDCPPLTAGVIANLAIDLSNTTGNRTRTLSTANPLCSNASFATDRCQCDTCNNTQAQACSTNADCPISGGNPGICGGKRCISGANQGAPCTLASECPGSSCNTTGTKTQPNQCDGGDTDCMPGDNTPPTSANDHICGTGPFEQFCGPTETFRGCTSNADCGFAGDTCSVSRFRECFDTGHVGDVVTSSGVVSAPSNHQSNPTLAALFCIGPTASSSVNGAAGLPGLGRLEIQGHSTDNGTP